MVVGGDNLADNQESSLEIYNRSGSIKSELNLELVKIKKHNNVEAILTLFRIRKKFSWSRGPPTRAKRDSCRFLEPHAGDLSRTDLLLNYTSEPLKMTIILILKGLASYYLAKTTFTFHVSILTLSNAFLSIKNREMKSESGSSLAMISLEAFG